MASPNPLRWMADLADRFEMRGVYVPGEDSRNVQPWREFGWIFVGWLAALGMFILLFALAS
ncbi:MAG: hypothetical protein ACRDSE_13615 [Pseudonocardiaceae bacterium]